MNPIYQTYRPNGFESVNSYLFVSDPISLIEFLKEAFYAEEQHRSLDPETGDISNCILKLGTSCIMISQAREAFVNMRTAIYLYVEDVDTLHERAKQFGGQEVFAPADMPYEDRQSGIIDPAGNYWWLSKRLVQQGYGE